MSTSLRSSLGAVRDELVRSLGTLVGLLWLCFVVGVIVGRAVDASIHDVPFPVELLWLGAFAVAVVGAGWLADGGYERLGADPDAGWTFVWLAAFFVPLAFVPLRIAIGLVAADGPLLDALFVLAATIAAGWLAFDDGLERLGLAPDDFLRVLVFAIALGSLPIAALALFDATWLTDARVGAPVAVAVQVAACWLGVASDVP